MEWEAQLNVCFWHKADIARYRLPTPSQVNLIGEPLFHEKWAYLVVSNGLREFFWRDPVHVLQVLICAGRKKEFDNLAATFGIKNGAPQRAVSMSVLGIYVCSALEQ